MKFSEINNKLGLDAADYFYSCYRMPEPGLLPVRSFNRKDSVQAYVIASDTKEDRNDTFYKGEDEDLRQSFYALQRLPKFFFLMIIQNYKLDCVYIPDEIYLDIEEAALAAREELRYYKKI